MKKLAPLAALLMFPLPIAACSGEPTRDPSQYPISRDELLRGSKESDAREGTYRRYCVGCHGLDGRGNGGVTGADFTTATSPFLTKSDTELLVSVRDGKRGLTATMPAHKPVLSEAQILGVLGYAREKYAPAAAPTPAPTP